MKNPFATSKFNTLPNGAGEPLPRLLLLFAFLLSAPAIFSQQAPNLSFREIPYPPVANAGFTSAAQDSMGFLWFGSFQALWKYNGLDFEKITHVAGDTNSLTHSRPEMVMSGNRNDLWIGTTRGGISRLEHRTGKFTSWRHDPDDKGTIGGNEIGGMAVDADGFVWAGSNQYCLNRIDPSTGLVKRFHPKMPSLPTGNYSPYLGSISVDPTDENLLWIGSPFGIFEFDKKNKQFTLHAFPKAIDYIFKPQPVNVFVDPKGNVWTANGFGSVKWLRREQEWEALTPPLAGHKNALEAWGPTPYLLFSEQEILILPRLEGLCFYNVFSGESYLFNKSTGHPGLEGSHSFRFVIKDQQGALWFGSSSQLFKASEPEWRWQYLSFPNKEQHNWTASLLPLPSENAVFIGTKHGEGLIHYDLDTDTASPYRYSNIGYKGSDATMQDLCFDSQKNVWIASSEGLLKLDAVSNKIERVDMWIGEPSHPFAVNSVLYDNETLWVGTMKNGLYALSVLENQPTEWSTKHGGILEGLEINDLLRVGDGRLLIATNHGLCLYDFENNTFHEGQRFLIKGIEVTHLEFASDNSVWVSTYGHGLYRFDPSQLTDFENFTTNIISNGNDIYHFCFSEKGDIWMHTDGGMLSFDTTENRFQHYPEFGVGLRGPLALMPNGHLVTGTQKGIRYFHPEEVDVRNVPPVPYLSNIDIGNRTENFQLAPDYITQVTLLPSERELTIGFDALNFNKQAGTAFSYRLLGVHDDWRSLKNQRSLTFNNLEPGSYTLEISAVNEYGKRSEQPKRLDITVLPPIYETWWFRAALAALLGGLGFGFYKYLRLRQTKKLQEIQQEREFLNIQKEIAESKLTALQAQMNPHFIFNSLNSINWYILKNRPKEASQYLTKFSRLVRLILDNSKNLTIPLDKELDSLKLYLDLEAMRFEGKFEYAIQIDSDIEMEEVTVPPLILQPFVENAIWHGLMHKKEKGKLLVQIFPETGHLKCIVEDNGIGRKAARELQSQNQQQHQSKGMKLTNDRLQLLHRNFLKEDMIRVIDLEDENGVAVGTRVEVLLPDG